jgi:hypothetical protein
MTNAKAQSSKETQMIKRQTRKYKQIFDILTFEIDLIFGF